MPDNAFSLPAAGIVVTPGAAASAAPIPSATPRPEPVQTPAPETTPVDAVEGGSAEDFSFVLGQGRMLPEFEDAIRGMKAGEKKTFPLTFPEDYGHKDLNGASVEFAVEILSVEAPSYPELNDEFAESLGIESVEKMREEVKVNLEREVAARIENKNKAEIFQLLNDTLTFAVPHVLVEDQARVVANSYVQQFVARGAKADAFKNLPLDMFKPEAEKQVRLGLFVDSLINEEKLAPTNEQLEKAAHTLAAAYEQPEEVVTEEQPIVAQTDESPMKVKKEPEKKEVQPEKKEPEPEVAVRPKEKTEAEKRAEAEKAAAQAAASKIAGAFGKGSKMGGSGNGSETGRQGSPTGNGSEGKATGVGGVGVFDLQGRSLGTGSLPVPVYNVQDEGRVVVTIVVDPAGRVIRTSINKRTNTVNPALRRAALEAAAKARFNEIDGVDNQSGTITYYFKLK